MPALNYKRQFAPKVKSGEKVCTIRARRKRPIRVGETLYHYTGMRTSRCRKLCTSVCMVTTPIRIYRDRRSKLRVVKLDGRELNQAERERLATRDGFEDVFSFFQFFETTHGLPFEGDLIEW